MALTRTIRETVKARIQADDGFRHALFSHAMEVMLADDMATAKSVLKDYIDATIGFDDLATESGLSVRHLKRMFQPSGNPRAGEMFRVIGILQRHQGIQLEVSTAA
jgi:DNA-binding phage protein